MPSFSRDPTGRFPKRPYYTEVELDRLCEGIITEFLLERYGKVQYPLSTDDLMLLIERNVAGLDLYADLSRYGKDVEGVTEFKQGQKPVVRISFGISEDVRLTNRLRTTLSHEFGHVQLHTQLWEGASGQVLLPGIALQEGSASCKREAMLGEAKSDWMEWQAGYVCGALLMPKAAAKTTCAQYMEREHLFGEVSLDTVHAHALIGRVAEAFAVSREAARVRLLKLRVLSPAPPRKALFE